MNELENILLNNPIEPENANTPPQPPPLSNKKPYKYVDGFLQHRKSRTYKDSRNQSINLAKLAAIAASLANNVAEFPKKRHYAKRGTGKDSNGQRIRSHDSKKNRKWAQIARRSKTKATDSESQLTSYITATNLSATLSATNWGNDSREIQVQFAREYLKMDEAFIANTPPNIFSGFYTTWKVSDAHYLINK
jgi:hypothetical protein